MALSSYDGLVLVSINGPDQATQGAAIVLADDVLTGQIKLIGLGGSTRPRHSLLRAIEQICGKPIACFFEQRKNSSTPNRSALRAKSYSIF